MKTLIRSSLVALALIGTVSAVSAEPRHVDHSSYGNSFDSGVIANFNRAAHIEE